MVDLASYVKGLKISWIRRVLTRSDKLIDNSFWRDVALVWADYNNLSKPQHIANILNEPIWFNKHIHLGYI
jgi:hypothetical protein